MAEQFVTEAHEIWSGIFHPEEETSKQLESWMKELTTCDKYLALQGGMKKVSSRKEKGK